jgi:hypothetical protein
MRILSIAFLLVCSVNVALGNPACGQSESRVRSLSEEAEANAFTIRRVEIAGNKTIRHNEFVKRLGQLNEGNIFTRRALFRAIKRVSKIDRIKPIALDDFELRLVRDSKSVDILICVDERQ